MVASPRVSAPPRTHLLLIAVQVCFASMAVVGKHALAHIPPGAIVMTRVAGGAIVFALLARLWEGPPASGRVGARQVALLVACAILGVAANQLLFIHGLARTTATSASVLGTSIPVFTAGIAMLAGRERFRPLRVAGIAVALGGALVLVKVDRFSWSDADAVGNLLILLNSLSYGTFLVVVRALSPHLGPLPLVALLFAIAIPLVAPAGIPAWIELAPVLTARDVGLLVFLLAVPTVAAYALNQVALARAESSLVAVYIYLQPLFATLGAMATLGERPGVRTLVAAVLILAGLGLSTRR
jgi:drug/metabolite transporter (DMT)-like permease